VQLWSNKLQNKRLGNNNSVGKMKLLMNNESMMLRWPFYLNRKLKK